MAKTSPVYRSDRLVVHFKLDRKGINLMAKSDQIYDPCRRLAEEKGLPYAVSISPRSNREDHVHYQDAWKVDRVMVHGIGIPPMVRTGARLINTSEQATMVEVGTDTSPRYRVLGEVIDHLNGLFRR
jgi:hypothetical protein